MKTLKDIDVKNKTVLLRCDLNVPIKNGNIVDDTRIDKSLKTIKYLIEKNSKVVILSHFGRVKTLDDKKDNSLKLVSEKLSEKLKKKVTFIPTCYHELLDSKIKKISYGKVILLENTRFMDLDNKKESNNDQNLAKYWSRLGDIFINDAFGASHRSHASNSGIAKFIPSAVGLLVEEEIANLKPLIDIEKRPFTVFMGGAKVEDKLPIIKKLLPKCDYLLLGGGILNSFLKASGEDVMDSLVTKSSEVLDELKDLLKQYNDKIIMTKQFIISENKILDVNVDCYKKYLYESKLIFINGTPGLFEDNRFIKGTIDLFHILNDADAKVIVGGGDTVNALNMFGFKHNFDFISSGGGATLEYIANGKLSALEEIK